MTKRSPTRYPYNQTPNQTLQTVTQEVSWAAHLPPPVILEQYNKIIPSFSIDLHKEVFKEAGHRRSCDSWLIKGGTIRALVGQVFAFIIVLAALYVAYQLGMAGHTTTAAVIVAIDLVGIAGAFLGREYIARNDKPKIDNRPVIVPPPKETPKNDPPE